MGCRLGRRRQPRRRRVDGRVPDPPQPAPLRRRPRDPGVGLAVRPDPLPNRRGVLLEPDEPGRGRHGVAVRDPPRPPRPPPAAPVGDHALRRLGADTGPRRRGRPVLLLERPGAARRPGRQVRTHERSHAHRHRQPGLRAGRGGPGARQPGRLRVVVRRTAPVLRRGHRRVQHAAAALLRHEPPRSALHAPHRAEPAARQLRLPGGDRCGRRRGDDLHRRAPAEHHPGRRQAVGPRRPVLGGRAERRHRAGVRPVPRLRPHRLARRR